MKGWEMENGDELVTYGDLLELIRIIGENTMQLLSMCCILAKHADLGGDNEEFSKTAATLALAALTVVKGGDD